MTAPDIPNDQPTAATPSFRDLVRDPSLVEALEKGGIRIPTPVQAGALPIIGNGQDLIVQAQTGSGKTLAYALPLIELVRSLPNQRGTIGLIVSPTRELAVQVQEVMSLLAPDIKPVCVIGGASSVGQIRGLEADQRVIVGTPGRLLDLIRRREIVLRKCRYFVLDEADEMLSMGFLEDVRAILSRLPDKRQGLFISATITPRVRMLSQSFLTKPQTLTIEAPEGSAPDIEHLYCNVGGELTAKASAISDLIETERPESAIIFCNTKSETELVEVFLRRRGFDARRINSDLSQSQRARIMKSIRDHELRILVATDVAARGIDIEQIDLVMNYSIHDQPETYVHRTGRTGRAGRQGKAISLVGPRDFSAFLTLKNELPIRIEKMSLPSAKELQEARLIHFYEFMRGGTLEVSGKEVSIAKAILKDLGDIDDAPEELCDMVAKLYLLSLKSFEKTETASLDEEDSDQDGDTPKTSGRNHTNSANRRRPHGRSGGRHKRRD